MTLRQLWGYKNEKDHVDLRGLRVGEDALADQAASLVCKRAKRLRFSHLPADTGEEQSNGTKIQAVNCSVSRYAFNLNDYLMLVVPNRRR